MLRQSIAIVWKLFDFLNGTRANSYFGNIESPANGWIALNAMH